MAAEFPTEGVELTQLRVISNIEKSQWFYCSFRDPDGHLLEITEVV